MLMMRTPQELDTNYTAIKKKIDADYLANLSLWQTYWAEASLDTRLEAGDPGLMGELYPMMPQNARASWYFNRVRPICNMVSGFQRRNRKSTIVVPLENGDQDTADQWTKIMLGIFKRENVYDTISDAFHQGACVTGMNLLHVYLDFTNDPINGDIKIDNCSYNSFYIDPYFRKPDLSDCEFVWKRTYLSHAAAAALFPDRFEEIMDLPGNPTGSARDNRFQYMPESSGRSMMNRLAYDEYYYRSYRDQKLLVDKETGETLDVTNAENIEIELFLLENPQTKLIKQTIPTVRMAIMIQDKVFYDGPQPTGIDIYPFVPVMGFYNPMMPYFYSRIQGLCRSLRDPQILYNRRVLLSADAAESVVNSGWIFKTDAIIDVKHLFQTGQGRVIPLKKEAQMTDIQQITPPAIPQYFFQLQDTFSKEMNQVSGVNEELLGSAIDDKAGILSALRQGAGLTTLQPLFDKLDNAQNLLGELIMKVVRANYTPGKIKQMLEGEEPAPLFYNKSFGKYHCIVELGFDTESQKQMQFAQMVQLKQIGVNIPEVNILEAATIQNKGEILKVMQQQAEQQQQMQMQQAQVQMQELQSRSNLSEARAEADRGLAVERQGRTLSNIGLAVERRAEAQKDRELGLLHLAKALKELENMDIDQMYRILELARLMKDQEQEVAQIQQPMQQQDGTLNPLR